MMTLVEKHLAKLKTIKSKHHQSKTECQKNFKALEDCLRCELAARKKERKKEKRLQKQRRDNKEKQLSMVRSLSTW